MTESNESDLFFWFSPKNPKAVNNSTSHQQIFTLLHKDSVKSQTDQERRCEQPGIKISVTTVFSLQ
jgi:hypothetical protein